MSDLERLQKSLLEDQGYRFLCIENTTTGVRLTAYQFPSMEIAAVFEFDQHGNFPDKCLL